MDEIKSMLREVLELEGLLMVADSRGDETPDAVFTLIKEKIEQLREYTSCLPDVAVVEQFDEQEPVVEPEDEPEDELEAEPEPEQEVEPEIEPEVEAEPEIEEDPEPEPEEELEAEPEPEQEVVAELEIEEEPEPEPEEELEAEIEPEEELEPEIVPEIEAEPEPEIIKNVDETAPEAIITLDEAFIRNKAKDLKSAFSLNDTFRFRRELFGNSAADMNDAIDLVNAMNSYEEAEDYFINDLGWDAESDEVGEFMEIIRNHFIAQ
ncbi:MAG: hypothetical protein MR865_06935 [Bacteroidales bacterium]|nr:hypothetical protein [Bacteroidales bacterium]